MSPQLHLIMHIRKLRIKSMKKYDKDLLSAAYKNHQINLIVLTTKDEGRLLAMDLNLCNI